MGDSKLNNITKLTAILTCLSLIIGIFIGLIQIRDSLSKAYITLEKANQTLDVIKIEALGNVINILDTNYNIRIKQANFDKIRFDEDLEKVNRLINAGKTGEQIYYSEEFKNFREIAAHYERLSVLISLNYIEFDVVFRVIAFPDNFWKDSKALREAISANWFSEGVFLDDFLSGFLYLCERYNKARLSSNYSSGEGMVCI